MYSSRNANQQVNQSLNFPTRKVQCNKIQVKVLLSALALSSKVQSPKVQAECTSTQLQSSKFKSSKHQLSWQWAQLTDWAECCGAHDAPWESLSLDQHCWLSGLSTDIPHCLTLATLASAKMNVHTFWPIPSNSPIAHERTITPINQITQSWTSKY